MKEEYILPVSILAAAVLIAGAVIYTAGMPGAIDNGGNAENKPVVVTSDVLKLTNEDVVLGDLNAPVTIIEYSDFQCPFCGRFFTQTETQVRENYIKNNQVKFVYRHFAFLSEESNKAAEAVECAKDQGKFWDFHDAIFISEEKDGKEHNGNLNRALFMSMAAGLGMDTEQFGSCFDSQKYAAKVNRDKAEAQTIGVQATPTLFVNGTKIEGAMPYAQFKAAIDQALAK